MGYRRQGKSSVLRYIKDRPEIFFPAAQQPLIVSLDLQAGQFHSPEGVTEGIRRAIAGHLGEEFWTRAENTDLFAVEDGLEEVRHRGYRLILLLDEFERVQLKDFQDWGEDCRSKMSAGIFTIVIATKRPIYEAYHSLNLTSPFDNLFSMTVLGALEREAWEEGVRAGFQGTIEQKELNWIEDIAGALPFYVQMAASMLWQYEDIDSSQKAMREQVKPHFQYLWDNLSSEERSALKFVVGYSDVEQPSLQILAHLERHGLLKQSRKRVFSRLFEYFLQQL